MARQYLWLGACSEVVLSRPPLDPLPHFIEKDSPADLALHEKARELADENYLEDWAAELNADYFDDELKFDLKWSHALIATGGGARGKTDVRHGKVIRDGRITISYRLAYHAYTDTEICVEYLLMHEMAHMLEMLRVKDSKMSSINTAMNHHYAFWLIVARNPNAVNGHHLFLGKDFPIDLTPLSKRKIYIDPRSKGTRLASTGYPEGETIKILPKGM